MTQPFELTSRDERGAERIARYVLERARARSPHTWRQAPRRKEQRAEGAAGSVPALAVFRAYGIAGVPELARRGLSLVEDGFPVVVGEAPLAPEELLALQARGARCVTLLPEGKVPPAPHADGLDFVLHDLCHLAKFADAEHHAGQVGLFATLARAFAAPSWRRLELDLDAAWAADRAAVSADMNGSCVFLLAVLKMRLKMAARRSLARQTARPAPTAGAATPAEELVFTRLFTALLSAMELPDEVRSAALTTSTRRDDVPGALRLQAHFEAVGRSLVAPAPLHAARLNP